MTARWPSPIWQHLAVTDPLSPVLGLVGLWRGGGQGAYPTIEPFAFGEELRFSVVPGKPFFAYSSRTTHADDGRPLHAETGWLRAVGDDRFELAVAQGSGVVEVVEGALTPDGDGLDLVSTLVGGSTTAKSVTATTRSYRWTVDRISYDLAMAAVGQDLHHHLTGELFRDQAG